MISRPITTCLILLAFLYPLYGSNATDPVNSRQNNSNNSPEITASVSNNKVHVGELVKLTLKYNLPAGSIFNPETDFDGLAGLTVIDRKMSMDSLSLTILIDNIHSFDVGPVSLSFKDSKGDLNIIRTEKIRLEVLSNLPENQADAKLKHIIDIIPTYPLWRRVLPWASGLLLLLIVFLGIYLWRKKRLNKRNSIIESRPPHVIAMEEIKKLVSMRLLEKGFHKDYYFRFSEILRQYMEKIRGFPAAELTTEEIVKRIKDERDRKIINLLRKADLVKFADKHPTKSDNEEDIKLAIRYIRETTPFPSVADHGAVITGS